MTVAILFVVCLFLSITQLARTDVYVYNGSNKLVEDYDDQPAGFGPAFQSDGLKGFITTTKPIDGCTAIAPPPNVPTSGYAWIALIPRTRSNGSCDFDLKVLNAQAANFSAVIVYNYDDTLITMGARGRKINIPSTLISHADGLSLISHYVYNRTSANSTFSYHVKIMSEQPFRIASYLVPFAVMVGTTLLGFIGFMFVKCYLERRRSRRHRLPRSALKQLKTKKFVKGDRWEVCAICLDDYVDGAKLRILPCDHAYHMKCIDPWLINNRRQCPVCKRYVFPHRAEGDEDDASEQQPRQSSERTPLLQSTGTSPVVESSRDRRAAGRSSVNPSDVGVPNISFAINESSDSDEGPSSSSRPLTTNSSMVNDRIVVRPSSSSRRFRHQPLPRLSLLRSSGNETTANTYGSVQDSPVTPFATPRPEDFSEDPVSDNATQNANLVIEDTSDSVDDDDSEHMHSVISNSGTNPTYVDDEDDDETAPNVLSTNL